MADNALRRRKVPGDPTANKADLVTASSTNDEDVKKQAPSTQQVKPVPFLSRHGDVITPVLLTVLSFVSRLYQISYGNFVVWDEAHFGKFGSFYLRRTFYFDVHPPLGKLLVGLSGLLAGYDGSFDFTSGATYPESLNYPVMRFFLAIFGALLVPLAYGTAIELGFSRRGAFLAGLLVLCENSLLVISRFILLDSMLLFFTALSVYSLTGFHSERRKPFSFDWWTWLLFSGISLGLVASVKWVGLFSVALVGVYTLFDLFAKFGDKSISVRHYAKHWLARILGLIFVPIVIYMLSFALHFAVLNRSGDGDAQMSSLFQAGLRGSDLVDNPLEVVYGSGVTLRTSAYGVGLLHSHIQKFPVGSQEQQITTYNHKDDNNYWIVERGWNQTNERRQAGLNTLDEPLEPLKHGSIIRLFHNSTKAYLHLNDIPAPITKSALEVSGSNTELDQYDPSYEWRVELIDDLSIKHPTEVHALTTRFHLRHVERNCLLRAHNKNLPEWGFKQGEVVCDNENGPDDVANIWNVEWHRNEKLPPAPPSSFRTSFIRDFIHLNAAMWTSNNALVPDDTRDDRATSQAWEWPFMLVGMRMAGWGDEQVKFLLLGNPAVWWTSTICILLVGILVVVYDARQRRGYNDWQPGEYYNFLFSAYVIGGGWFFHYIPFFIMGRVLYVHHYLPALYISTLAIPFVIDHLTRRATVSTQRIVYGITVLVVVCTFAYFAPLTLGYKKPSEDMRGRSWLRKWQVVDYPIALD